MVDVTLVKGDGVGPELAEAAKRCVDATNPDINWDITEAGTDRRGNRGFQGDTVLLN